MATSNPKYWTRTDDYATPHASLDRARSYARELAATGESVALFERTRTGWVELPISPHAGTRKDDEMNYKGRGMTDLEARKIASEWHGGGGSALYAFASTGAIDTARPDHDLAREITECARLCRGKGGSDFTNLIDLRSYIRRNGPRGPLPKSQLTW